MIIYLHGPDSYQRHEKLQWYIGKFKEKHSALTVENFNLENKEDLDKLKSFATAQSLFDNFKFGILESIGEANAKDLQTIFKIASESKQITLAISVEKTLPKEYKVPTGGENKEHEFSGLDSWAKVTEEQKVALGGLPEKVVGVNNFFALATALQGASLISVKLPALERLLLDNDPAAIFNFVASRAGADLKTKMADYDAAIKSGKTDYPEALFALALGEGGA